MKKIVLFLALFLTITSFTFANSYNSYTDYYDNSNDYSANNNSSNKSGIAPGLKFSLFGVAPTLSYNRNKMEIESTLYMFRNPDNNQFNLIPSISLGYNTKPFSKGFQTFVALNYTFTNSNLLHTEELGDYQIHMANFQFRTAYQWKSGISFYTNLLLPLFVYSQDTEETNIYSIIDSGYGLPVSLSLSFLTFSVGMKVLIQF